MRDLVRFPLFLSLQTGLKILSAQFRPMALMCLIPFLVYAVTYTLLQALPFEISGFTAALSLLPANFLLGVVLAIIMRWHMLGEHPAQFSTPHETPSEQEIERTIDIRNAALASATVSFVFTGLLYAMWLRMLPYINLKDGVLTPTTPMPLGESLVLFGAMVVAVWGSRFMWLSFPIALSWNVFGFLKSLGAMRGSVRVFVLFSFCALISSLPFDMIRAGLLGALTPQQAEAQSFLAIVVDSVLTAGSHVLQGLLFTTTSIAAMKYSITQKGINT